MRDADANGINQSMSRAGKAYDNNFVEWCFVTIETKLEMTEHREKEQAGRGMARCIVYYNADRRRSSLGYLDLSKWGSNSLA